MKYFMISTLPAVLFMEDLVYSLIESLSKFKIISEQVLLREKKNNLQISLKIRPSKTNKNK